MTSRIGRGVEVDAVSWVECIFWDTGTMTALFGIVGSGISSSCSSANPSSAPDHLPPEYRQCPLFVCLFVYSHTSNFSAIWPHRHKTFEYSQGNSQLKYLSYRMVELEISSTLITSSVVSMYKLGKISAPSFTDSDIWLENFLENTQKFYDIGAWCLSPLSGPRSREGSLSCHSYCNTGPRFIRSHPKDRDPRPTVGFEPPTQESSDLCARRSNHCATRLGNLLFLQFVNKDIARQWALLQKKM
jgi:hypothetical protein